MCTEVRYNPRNTGKGNNKNKKRVKKEKEKKETSTKPPFRNLNDTNDESNLSDRNSHSQTSRQKTAESAASRCKISDLRPPCTIDSTKKHIDIKKMQKGVNMHLNC